jgi:hypothetical protein
LPGTQSVFVASLYHSRPAINVVLCYYFVAPPASGGVCFGNVD